MPCRASRNANNPYILPFACNLLGCDPPGVNGALFDRACSTLSNLILVRAAPGAGRSGQQQAGGSAAALDDSQYTPGGDSQPDMFLAHDPWAETSSARQVRGALVHETWQCTTPRDALLRTDSLRAARSQAHVQAAILPAASEGRRADRAEPPGAGQQPVADAALARRHAAYGNICPLDVRVIEESGGDTGWLF